MLVALRPFASRFLPGALARLGEACLLGLLPALLVAGALLEAWSKPGGMVDFGIFATAGEDVLAGRSPYPTAAELAGSAGGYLYPPVLAWLIAPLGALSVSSAQLLFVTLSAACIPLALLALGVRDWRCYGAALLAQPVVYSLQIGTAGPLAQLGVAVAWRWRERLVVSGMVVGFLVAVKPFLWPLVLWPLLRGSRSGSGAAVATGFAAATIAWAAIGFAGLGEYPDVVREVAELRASQSYSLTGLLQAAGVSRVVATAVAVVAALALLGWTRRRGSRGERTRDAVTLTACLAAALLASPIVWSHYYVLLLAPIALARPRLAPVWFVPPALFLLPHPSWTDGDPGTIAPLFIVTSIVLAWAWQANFRRAD
jgi:hypothetical protein